jgi:hypothetical protein
MKRTKKIVLNFVSLCFVSKQKLLNRSEAKNLKRKKRKNRLEFPFALFHFEAKMNKVKRSKKFEVKISEKKLKKRFEIL